LLNYTTTVAAARSISEMQTMLARHGAAAVATRYADGEPSGLSFTLETPLGQRAFTLPVNVNGVLSVLRADPKVRRAGSRYLTPEHAARVAWRVAKDWLEAQLAIIDANMATLDQVMLPYLHVEGERTLYEAYVEREMLALEAAPFRDDEGEAQQ
jgi:hypothetical protein